MAVNLPTPITGSQILNNTPTTGGALLPNGNPVPLWMSGTPQPSSSSGGGGGGGGSWGPTTPTTVVSSKPKAVATAQTAVNNYNTQQVNNATTAQQAKDLDAATLPGDRYMRGTGGLNPNYVAPQTTGGPTTDPLKQAQTDAILHDGETKVYNQYTGQEEWIKTPTDGTMPSGYSTLNPMSRNDVSDSIQDAEGNTIKKFSDGTFARVDASGNYTLGSEQMFSDAKRVKELSDRLDNARKGIYDDGQKAILDGIQRDYAELIKKQENINANTTGGTTIAMARAGLGNQILGQQKIDKTVNDGIDAIAKLTAQRDTALANMKRAFESDDMNALNAAYDIYSKSSDDIQLQIDKTAAAVQSAKDKQELNNRSNAITMGNKYADATETILPSDTPEEVQRKLKSSAIWQNEQKTKAGQVDQEVVDGAYAIWLKNPGQLPTGFSAMSQAIKNALYKKIGGDPDSVDEAVLNKAIISGKTAALRVQETQLGGTKTAIKTLDKTLDLAQVYSNKVDRSGSPFAAKYALFLQGKIAGDADTAAFNALMKTAAAEYAKIMSGSASSISGATVSSVEDAQSFISAEMSKGQIDEVIKILKKDAHFRLESQEDTIKSIQDDIKTTGSTSSGTNNTTGPNPVVGKTAKGGLSF